jgi:MtfA peptidase
MTYFIGIIVTAIIVWWIVLQLQHQRRKKLFQKSLPPEWIQILKHNMPLYALLPQDLKQTLHGCINLFLYEKEFIGCNGLEITDQMRLTIAGNASILLLKRDNHRYKGFTSILVYPETYIANEIKYDGLVEIHQQSARAGESWHRGPVVLSWSDIMHDRLKEHKGHNVILHEFAHKLDEENTIMDGLPVLRNRADYTEWAKVLNKEFHELQERVNNGTNTVLDSYATVSPPEFFAVATESFFEKPVEMKTKLPELYEQLKRFYDLDPAIWHNNAQA